MGVAYINFDIGASLISQRPIQAGIVNILAILMAVAARFTMRCTSPVMASDTAGTRLAAKDVVKMIGNLSTM